MAERRGAAAAALTGGGRGGANPAVAARNSWRCRAGSRRQSQAGLPQWAPALCSPLGRSWTLSPLPARPSPLFLTGRTPGQPQPPSAAIAIPLLLPVPAARGELSAFQDAVEQAALAGIPGRVPGPYSRLRAEQCQ